MNEVLRSVLLRCSPARAFALFTQQVGEWWPVSRRHTGELQSQMFLLPTGRFFERSSTGKEVELGRVRHWKADQLLELDFYVGTSVEAPTKVTVSFVAEGYATRVTIRHRPTPVSQALWDQRAPRFDSSWEAVLSAFEHALPIVDP